jgi:hypothetical protein
MDIPGLSPSMDLMFGLVSWSAIMTGVITLVTKYKPLTVEQLNLLKGALAVLGYVLHAGIANNPEYGS